MTKSTITREESIQAVFDLKVGYTLGLADIEILKRVARMALAAMDSDPVAYMYDGEDGTEYNGHNEFSGGGKGIPLYRHAQPAPVAYSDFEEFWSACIHPLAQDDELKDFAWDIWNACRAAMLAAAPHDTPALNSVQSVVTVPGKWIPVSERMPEVGVKVLCFPAEDEPIHAVFNGQLWLQDVSWSGSEEPIDNVIPVTVTHWMPLPAGPQEVR
ncbi:TPA: DUF551 domain-containing protein [Klebsiella pneumoniae]|nr:DUF551 domain-containing protein [Klebsiella pneumoniae]HBT5149600.1 DUF551 domain-containing protein [Klebsiella pneumoniae]HBX0008887.1 DUF551 domain-containing protein [Klebsiella pneumoniae]